MKRILLLLLLATIFSSMVLAAQGKRILVIESYNKEYLWDAEYKKGLELSISKNNQLVYFEMDTKRLPKSEHQKSADLAYRKYQEIKPDLVILGDDAALQLVGPKLASEKIPVVFLGINNNPRDYFKRMPDNMTGVLERPLLKRSIKYLSEIIPRIKRVLILFDTNLTAVVTKKEIFNNLSHMKIDDIEVDLVMVDTYNNWKKFVNDSKGKYQLIITGLYQTIIDEKGKNVNPEEVIEWTANNSPNPIFGFWDFSIGKGKAIGGYVLAGRTFGIKAGNIVNKVLKGEKPKNIVPVYEDEGVFLFNKSQLEKWNLKLPENIAKLTKYID